MSRYHPVRPKKNKHKHQQQQQQATAPMPTVEQMETVARGRLQATMDEVYKLHHGDTLDASIARCNRLLATHDREYAEMSKREKIEGYRWAVSPAMVFRLQREIERLEARQDKLKEECWQIAKQLMAEYAQEQLAKAQSLCPPKETEAATQAATGATPANAPATSAGERGQANAGSIAA